MEKIILLIGYIILFYLLIGIIFSIFFYLKGINKVDEVAIGSTLGFKLVVFPGIVVFWPVLLSKWIQTKQP